MDTKHGPTESEAAIGRIRRQQYLRLADPEPNQQPPCQTNRTSGGDTKGCTDASFDVSPTSPESQPCLGESHKQQLVTEAIGATSQPGIMMIDALCDEGFSHGAGNTPIST